MVSKRLEYIRKITFCAIFVALLVVSGMYVKINIPPVPFSTLTVVAMLSAVLLGKYLAPLSFSIYVAMGLSGLHVFAKGLAGPSYVFQPSFGYLIGYIISGFIVGLLIERIKDNTKQKEYELEVLTDKKSRLLVRLKYNVFLKRLLATLVGLFIVHLFGVGYFCLMQTFYFNQPFDFWKVLVSFSLIFLPSDIAQCVLACFIGGKLKKALRLNK